MEHRQTMFIEEIVKLMTPKVIEYKIYTNGNTALHTAANRGITEGDNDCLDHALLGLHLDHALLGLYMDMVFILLKLGITTFVQEIKGVIQSVPEIVELVGNVEADQLLHVSKEDGEEKVKFVMQAVFTHLMSACKDSVSKMVSKLKSCVIEAHKERQLLDKEQLVLRLETEYPGDIGVLSAFFLNYVKLNPGEALYLGANEPHAYIHGECVECMATSDNVVRAGLTTKLRDVPTLCSMLTYRQGYPDILQGDTVNQHVMQYMPPFDKFEVDRCNLPEGESTDFHAFLGPSLFVEVDKAIIAIFILRFIQGDKISLSMEPSLQNIYFGEGSLINLKLTSSKLWILKDEGLELYDILNNDVNLEKVHSYGMQEVFVSDQLLQVSEHSSDDMSGRIDGFITVFMLQERS